MDPALEHVQRARRLIADLEAPAQPRLQSPSRARDPNSGLNGDQELAVDRCVFEATFATQMAITYAVVASLPFCSWFG